MVELLLPLKPSIISGYDVFKSIKQLEYLSIT